MNKTVLAFGIIFLLIGVSVVSSTENVVKDTHTDYQPLESIIESEGLLSNGKIAYCSMVISGGSEELYWFELNDTGTMNFLADSESGDFLAGGTWTCDGEWYGCEHNTGRLWTINPNNGDMTNIGGGGTSCNGLSWDPVNNRLYGASSTHLIEYDPETGEQETIGSFGWSNAINAIAINSDGDCYAWDVLWNDSSTLLKVDLETGEVTVVGEIGCPINMSGDGHFDFETGLLYITNGVNLIKYDVDTGNCTVSGDFQSGAERTCLAIPYDQTPPITTHSLFPPEPDGCNGWYVSDVNVTVNATDDMSGVKEIKYRIDWEVTHTIDGDNGTFLITQADDGNDVRIEYWAIDNAGNEESRNIFFIDMDQTDPIIDLTYDIVEGNPWVGWLLRFTVTATDDTSGMERVEFYINDELQETINGTGPIYEWEWEERWDGVLSIDITAIAYDRAGNIASDYTDPRTSHNQKMQLSKSTEDTNGIGPDIHKVDYDYAIIRGYFETCDYKGFILWRDVYFGAGAHEKYLEIDFYRFPDIHVHYEDYLTRVTADYFIPLSWPFSPYHEIKGIAFGNIEYWG